MEISTFGNHPGTTGPVIAASMVWKDLVIPANKVITVVWDHFSACSNSWVLCNDTSTLAFEGCSTGSSTRSVTIPAGTTKLKLFIIGNCSGINPCDDLWTFQIFC